MMRNKLIGISLIILAIFAVIGMYFFFQDPKNEENNQPAITETQSSNFETVDQSTNNIENAEYFESLGLGKLKIETFGGASDVKTSVLNGKEYALFRNPKNIGGLDFVLANENGNYYFAENDLGEKIIFEKGTPEGEFGYEATLVSGRFIGDLNSQTEYYSAYPIKNIALQSGIKAIEDGGVSNRFLNSKYLKITNLNNNVSVITTIETRSEKEGVVMVSEATRRALKVDENAIGSFSLEIVDKESNSLGVMR